jgi:hypothetical protein
MNEISISPPAPSLPTGVCQLSGDSGSLQFIRSVERSIFAVTKFQGDVRTLENSISH